MNGRLNPLVAATRYLHAEEDVIEVVFSDLEDTVVHVEHDGENYPADGNGFCLHRTITRALRFTPCTGPYGGCWDRF